MLPVEFARISKDGRLTLVIYPSAKDVQVLWKVSSEKKMDIAVDNLACRDGTSCKAIGIVSEKSTKPLDLSKKHMGRIREWAEGKGLNAVIWTGLKSNFKEKLGQEPTEDNVIKYLLSLRLTERTEAEKYIKKAPPQIKTTFRYTIEKNLVGASKIPFQN